MRPATSARRTSATSTSARWPGAAPANGSPLRRDFIDTRVVPRIGAAALDLVARHRDAGDLVLLTTATSRFLSELTAVHLGIAQLIATECETGPDGRFTGRSRACSTCARARCSACATGWRASSWSWLELRDHALQRFDQRPAAAQRREARGGGQPGRAPGCRGGAARLAGPRAALSAVPRVPWTSDFLPLLVVTTLATREQALALGREMVERRLAACAQVGAIDSVYRWKGAVEHDTEFRLLLKTQPALYGRLGGGAARTPPLRAAGDPCHRHRAGRCGLRRVGARQYPALKHCRADPWHRCGLRAA